MAQRCANHQEFERSVGDFIAQCDAIMAKKSDWIDIPFEEIPDFTGKIETDLNLLKRDFDQVCRLSELLCTETSSEGMGKLTNQLDSLYAMNDRTQNELNEVKSNIGKRLEAWQRAIAVLDKLKNSIDMTEKQAQETSGKPEELEALRRIFANFELHVDPMISTLENSAFKENPKIKQDIAAVAVEKMKIMDRIDVLSAGVNQNEKFMNDLKDLELLLGDYESQLMQLQPQPNDTKSALYQHIGRCEEIAENLDQCRSQLDAFHARSSSPEVANNINALMSQRSRLRYLSDDLR